ncbi:MAG: N-acyl-D-amino-acid deacylase family protein [bacterium]|jgi:N-acyl-D-amino-acid deacylase
MLCAAALLAVLLGNNYTPQQAAYDILISGGRIVDGTGGVPFDADIAILDGRIAAIGRLAGARARRRIDARGLVVAPGFIDIHTHASGGIFAVPSAENYIRQGVTTVFDGQDGNAPVPLAPFLARLAATPIAVNFGMFAGQGSIRRAVMGTANRPASPAEIARMRTLVREAMLDGAFGLSTGLLYVPGSYTPTEEIIELARVAGSMGGIYISHMRDEAANVRESVAETIRIGREARVPAQLTHHKIVGVRNWGASRDTLRAVDEARRTGADISIDLYPYTASSTATSVLFPAWALEGGRAALARRVADASQRARIVAGIAERIRYDRGGGDAKNVVFSWCPFGGMEGLSLAEVARREGREPSPEGAAETLIGIELRGGCQAVFHAMAEEDVERILRHPQTMVASDGEISVFGEAAPHPRSYGTFARVLGRYVRERKLLTLQEAVRKMTSLPASRVGLNDRGRIAEGMRADVVVFDPARIADRATFTAPHQYAEGVRDVLVNGRPVLLGGVMTGERPGAVLYGPARRR